MKCDYDKILEKPKKFLKLRSTTFLILPVNLQILTLLQKLIGIY